MFAERIRKLFLSTSGNVESALVLIPLLTLFLIASQITIAIHLRNWEKISAQDSASTQAISGDFSDSNTYLHIDSPDPNQNLDLVITHKRRFLPLLVPRLPTIMGSQSEVDVSGLAVVENQR